MAQGGILLDTNVLSELMRPLPAPEVMAWFARQPVANLYTSAITQAEMLLGVALLPDGKRKHALAAAVSQMFEEDFAGACLAFDHVAAQEYALLVAGLQLKGVVMTTEDAQIAAIALRHQLVLATRNTKDFLNIPGLQLVNPWQTSP